MPGKKGLVCPVGVLTLGDAMTQFDGVLYDGRTAASHDVVVRFDETAVTIVFSDGRTDHWPIKSVKRVASPGGMLRLQPDARSLARLNINDQDKRVWAAFREACPRRLRGRDFAIAGLMVVAVVPVVALILAITVLAGPMARSLPPGIEAGMGAAYYDGVTEFWPVCDAAEMGEARAALDRMTNAIAEHAHDLAFDLVVQVVDADIPNAFALPGGYVLITDELLMLMDSPDQLAGVLAHEIAHVERRHGMVMFVRQMGLATVVDILFGGGAGVTQQLVYASIDLTAFANSRRAEAEADALAVSYLIDAGIDPTGLAEFFDAIHELTHDHDDEEGENGAVAWIDSVISTHPDTQNRAQFVRDRVADTPEAAGAAVFPSLNKFEWHALKTACPGDGDWRDAL